MKRIIAVLLIIAMGISFLLNNSEICLAEEIESRTLYVDDDGTQEYTSIIQAINNASDGDTIYVYSGVYDGYFLINKSINLIGANKENTIIRGGDFLLIRNGLITILANNVTISGFTIKNSTHPYYLTLHGIGPPTWIYDVAIGIIVESNFTKIIDNTITNNNGYGILLNQSHNILISNNEIKNHVFSCIYLKNSSNNIIINNTILNNEKGIVFHINSTDNVLYHNNFINNTYYHAYTESNNTFYNADLQQGNYWDDYNGTDRNNDAIGDTSYAISGDINQDPYPLILPYRGGLTTKGFFVDEDVVIHMLIIGIVIASIVSIPIAYAWYRKIRPPD
jgi:parallel beta-helix repeat protein